jgi:lysophospholipase L1-like esterase
LSVQISFKKQSLFGILFLILLLLAVEISMEVYEYITIPCGIFQNEAFSNLSYFEIKNICYDTNTVTHGKAPLYHLYPQQHKFTMNINSDGFRGPEIHHNGDEKYRIFVTGGSTAFGLGSTSDRTTIPGYLQNLFDIHHEDLNVEIINAGIQGANSYREVLLIKEKLVGFNPHAIISYTGANDRFKYLKEIIFEEADDDWKPDALKLANYPWLRTPFVINKIITQNSVKQESNPAEFVARNLDEIPENDEAFRKNWSQSCSFLRDNGIKSIVILQPTLTTKKFPSLFEKELLRAADIHRQSIPQNFSENLPLLNEECDLTIDLSSGIGGTLETTYYDLGHMNDLGNKIIASKIYEKILPTILNDIDKIED